MKSYSKQIKSTGGHIVVIVLDDGYTLVQTFRQHDDVLKRQEIVMSPEAILSLIEIISEMSQKNSSDGINKVCSNRTQKTSDEPK